MLNLNLVKESAVREIESFFATLNDKGARRFLRAFIAAGFTVFGSYELLYRPPQAKSDRLEGEISHAKQMHDYGEKYAFLRDSLTSAYARLPADVDRQQWLSNSVRALMDADKLQPDDFKPMQESDNNGLLLQESTLSLSMRFKDFYALMLHIESAKPLLHLQSAELTKKEGVGDPAFIGTALVHVDISTVIPKKRLDQ